MAADATARPAGAQAMMDRLLDRALVYTMRDWFDGQAADAPGRYRGPADPVAGNGVCRRGFRERPGFGARAAPPVTNLQACACRGRRYSRHEH